MLRSFLFDAVFVMWTALFALGIPVLWVAGSPRRPIRAVTRLWVRGVLVLLKVVVGLTYSEQGRAAKPDGPCLIISNHQSVWETLAFVVLFPDVAIIAKRELVKIPVVSWYLARSPMIIIDREAGSGALKQMLTSAQDALADGRSVLIFPEGTRKLPDAAIRFHRGAELLYARLNVPVLPVVIDSGRFWGAAQPFKRPGSVAVSYLSAIRPGLPPATFTKQAESLIQTERSRIDATRISSKCNP
ncbi:lysophospholipid acyltransferase family protein [Pseudotabrizicola sediminis]|nr:lysophospholipid acyltransferase family protein [Pseudotabrizicola sediminis]